MERAGTKILSVTYAIALAASAARAESNKPSEGAERHTRATDGDLERHAMRESSGALGTAAMVGFVRISGTTHSFNGGRGMRNRAGGCLGKLRCSTLSAKSAAVGGGITCID
jgi:hypothetical protein